MAASIYVTTPEPACGKSLICLGIMDMVLRKTKKVGIFRPIITERSPEKRDKNIDLILRHFDLDLDYEDTFAFRRHEAREMIAQGKQDALLDKIIDKYKKLEQKCDFVLVEGTDFVRERSAFDFNINVEVARNLGCPVLILGSANNRDINDAVSGVQLYLDQFIEKECEIAAVLLNRADPADAHELLMSMREKITLESPVLSVIPDNIVLKSPTMQEVADHLDAEILFGKDQLDRQAFRFSVASMQIQNYLEHLTENCLVITPGDRGDVIMSVLQAHQSTNYPPISGVILTTQYNPPATITRLLDGIPNLVPILSVEMNTFNTASKLGSIHSHIAPENTTKIALSLKIFEKYVDTKALEEKISTIKSRGVTPRMFEYNLVQKAKSSRKHIVLPEGRDLRVLKAAEYILENDIVDLTLLGNEDRIVTTIRQQGLRIDLDRIKIIEPATSPQFEEYTETLLEIRKAKGMTKEQAQDSMCDVSFYGTMMVHKGHADGMVSGAMHTTQHTIRPALQIIKTKKGCSTVSSVFFMCLEDRVLVYGDCAVNPNPNAEQLAEIAISSAETSLAFDVDPKVAMLSYSSGDSGKGAEVDKVREATKIAKERRPDLKIEGPIQYDAAVDKQVGSQKMPGSEVAGQASVLIFPDLNTGNNTYKAVQRETGAIAIGPVLQGLKKPVNDLSRGCTVPDIINTVVITAIQAQSIGEEL
ncbi:phosphate acetyltransferase [Flammeovirgaceae bacterium SG7u.111]|nr:phosphate acetyltransferase [Flammeovirgaceae bacterium SG7u.132]WPO35268.1 phosphate acetyltransferase [Flammeovirgaceae bacterium SG7u.111]